MPQKDPITTLREDMDRLRGRLFQTVESWGRPEKQETAMKGVIRQVTYDSQRELEAALRRGGHQ